MLSCLLAVLAACANATSSVLQRKANRKVPRRLNPSWRLIRSLLHQRVWFGGIAAICAGFLLQAAPDHASTDDRAGPCYVCQAKSLTSQSDAW